MNWTAMIIIVLGVGVGIYFIAKGFGLVSPSGKVNPKFRVNFFAQDRRDDIGWYKDELYKCGREISVTNPVGYSRHVLGPIVSKDYFLATSNNPFVIFIVRRAGGDYAHMDGRMEVIVVGNSSPGITTKIPVGNAKVYSYYSKVAPGDINPHGDMEWTPPEMIPDGQPYPKELV